MLPLGSSSSFERTEWTQVPFAADRGIDLSIKV